MGFFQTMSGYFKQFTGEVVGSQVLHDEGKKEAVKSGEAHPVIADPPESDAAGQFHRTRAGADNDGVASAKPRVITGSDDATVHKLPPGETSTDSEWSVGFDDRAPRADQSVARPEPGKEADHGRRS